MTSSSLNWNNITNIAKELKESAVASSVDSFAASEDGDMIEVDVEDCEDVDEEEFIFKRYDSRRKRKVVQTTVKKKARDYCSSCQKSSVIYDDGSYVCSSCGLIQGDLFSTTEETRSYSTDDRRKADPSRTGIPINELLPNASLTPIIGGYGREKYRELHKRYSMRYDERSLLNMINKTTAKLKKSDIPTCVLDKALTYYKILGEMNTKLRAVGDNFMGACLLYVCKKNGILKSSQDIADIMGIKNKNMAKGIESFQEILFRYNPEMLDIVKPTSAVDYIKQFSEELGLRKGIMDEALHVAEVAQQLGLTERNVPPSIAVGCIYLVSHTYSYGITRKQIFERTKISDVTILKSFQKLEPHKNYLLNRASLAELDVVEDDDGDYEEVVKGSVGRKGGGCKVSVLSKVMKAL